jgi:hypothetical protein
MATKSDYKKFFDLIVLKNFCKAYPIVPCYERVQRNLNNDAKLTKNFERRLQTGMLDFLDDLQEQAMEICAKKKC